MRPFHSQPATLTLSDTQPALQEPLSVSDLKVYLRVETDDDDALIASFISAAREQAELFQNRVLVRKSLLLTLYEWPRAIELPTPLISVDSVTANAPGGITTPLALGHDYYLSGNCVHPHLSTFSTSLVIAFTAGYSPTDPFWSHSGARLKAGMMLLISHWYSNRIPVANTTTSEYPYTITQCLSAGALRKV